MLFLPYTALLLMLTGCGKDSPEPKPPKDKIFFKGMDISFLPEIRQYGIQFSDEAGQKKDMLDILKSAGVNLIRIRLWTGSPAGHSGEEEVTALAGECRNKGFKVLLDLHYSDTWADPGKQYIPSSWKNLDNSTLLDSVYQYTYRITDKIRPDYIQIGNEVNNGLIWPAGKSDNGSMMDQILSTGCRAVRTVDKETGIMIHYAGLEGCEDFFKRITDRGVDFDIAGISYYPYWHGKSLSTVDFVLNNIQNKLHKETFIVEFAYPFTLGWNDHTNNIIGLESQLVSGYPATEEGQRDFIAAIRELCEHTGSMGFCYWGGEFVAFKGNNATDGSSWENQALFNFDFMANPGLEPFK